MPRAFFVFVLIASALPLRAERVRVVVAVRPPAGVSAASVSSERATVIDSLPEAKRVFRWGREGRVFSADVDAADVERLKNDPRVQAVEIDDGGQGGLLESLPLVGVDIVHAQGFSGEGITVAVLDTGIDVDNPDFAGRIVAQHCFCDNAGTGCCPGGLTEEDGQGSADDDNGHGTHVSGIMAGGGASATAGVAPKATIVAVKVMDRFNTFRDIDQVYKGLAWIADHHPEVGVINMSLGTNHLYTPGECGSSNSAIDIGLSEVVSRLRERGVLVTASTGNQASKTSMAIPACMQDVIGVGATYDTPGNFNYFNCPDSAGGPSHVTCWTNSSASVDLVAPGAPIVASRRGGGMALNYGTSMAAPHVAGAIALMLEASGRTLSADQIENILKATGVPVTDPANGLTFPRLDVAAAISATPRPPESGPHRRSVRH